MFPLLPIWQGKVKSYYKYPMQTKDLTPVTGHSPLPSSSPMAPHAQQTRIKLLSSFQESYLDHSHSHFEPKRVNLDDKSSDKRQVNSQNQDLNRLKSEIKEVEMLLELQRASRDFLLSKFPQQPSQTPNMDEICSTAEEFLSSGETYLHHLNKLQSHLSPQ